jgi:2,3-dihydroxyphenylpropionate 1,2-dioxygenase
MPSGPTVEVLCASHSPQMAQDVQRRQGLQFRAGFDTVARGVRAFDPTLIVYFGPDHMRSLVGIAPCFTVTETATGYGDWGTPKEDYTVPLEHAQALGDHLIDSGVDIAIAEHLTLDHGFGQTTFDLFDSLAAVPMIPIVVNCVGAPLATPARTAVLGRAVGAFIAQLPDTERVLVVASGGISHSPPSLIPGVRKLSEEERQALITDNLARAAEAINPDWDQDFLSRMADENWASLAELGAADLAPAGTGGSEVRTWIAALFTGNQPLRTVAYEPVEEWITGMGIAASTGLLPA